MSKKKRMVLLGGFLALISSASLFWKVRRSGEKEA
jgi:hypothetical protein